MAQVKVSGDMPTQIKAHSCAIAQTTNGYTLQVSVDGVNYDSWSAATPANEIAVINGLAYDSYIRLSGNTDEDVLITY